MIEYNIITEPFTDGYGKTYDRAYKVVKGSGVWYDAKTPDRVIESLEYAMNNKIRLRLYFGDRDTGRDWEEIHFIYGYISKSNGRKSSPLLIHNSRSSGGDLILTDSIVKIEESKGKRVLYKHQNYHIENQEGDKCELYI